MSMGGDDEDVPGGAAGDEGPFEGYEVARTPPYEGNVDDGLDPDSPIPPRPTAPWTTTGMAPPRDGGGRRRFPLIRALLLLAVGALVLLSVVRVATIEDEPSPPSPAPVLHGSMWIETQPTGAAVALDGEAVGTTPLSLPGLRTGAHALRLTLDDREPIESRIEIRAAQETVVRRELYPAEAGARGTGTLDLQSSPRAEVFHDGESLGRTPLRVVLPAGIVPLELVTEDGERHARAVMISRDHAQSTHIHLDAVILRTERGPSRPH